jgi:tetratricopeptide (TPR) repeat protein
MSNYTGALESITRAEEISWLRGDTLNMIKTARIKGQLLRRVNRTDKSLCVLEEVLPIGARNKIKNEEYLKEYMNLLRSISIIHTLQGNYSDALTYSLQCLSISELIGIDVDICSNLNNTGLIYYKLSNPEKAIEYYTKALELSVATKNQSFLDRLYINLGLSYNSKKEYAIAEGLIKKGLAICNNQCSTESKMEAAFGLGQIYFNLKMNDAAEMRARNSFQFAREINESRYQAENLLLLGRIALAKSDAPVAESYLLESRKIAKDIKDFAILIEVYKHCYLLAIVQKDLEKEAYFKGRYIDLKDSVYNMDLIKNITKTTSAFDERGNLQTINRQENIIKQQRLQSILIAIISGMFLFIIILLYSNYRKKVKFEVILEERIKFRTVELEKSRYELEYLNSVQSSKFQRIFNKYRAALNNIKGIYRLACLEASEPISLTYFNKINEITIKVMESDSDTY